MSNTITDDIEKLALDLTEKLSAAEIATLMTLLRFVLHGVVKGASDEAPKAVEAPVPPPRPYTSKAKPAKASAPRSAPEDDPNVF
jgi:hypothetical protein